MVRSTFSENSSVFRRALQSWKRVFKSFKPIPRSRSETNVFATSQLRKSKATQQKAFQVPAGIRHYTIAHLPDEMLAYVFSFLTGPEKCKAALVNRRWKRVAMSPESGWRALHVCIPVQPSQLPCRLHYFTEVQLEEKIDSLYTQIESAQLTLSYRPADFAWEGHMLREVIFPLLSRVLSHPHFNHCSSLAILNEARTTVTFSYEDTTWFVESFAALLSHTCPALSRLTCDLIAVGDATCVSTLTSILKIDSFAGPPIRPSALMSSPSSPSPRPVLSSIEALEVRSAADLEGFLSLPAPPTNLDAVRVEFLGSDQVDSSLDRMCELLRDVRIRYNGLPGLSVIFVGQSDADASTTLAHVLTSIFKTFSTGDYVRPDMRPLQHLFVRGKIDKSTLGTIGRYCSSLRSLDVDLTVEGGYDTDAVRLPPEEDVVVLVDELLRRGLMRISLGHFDWYQKRLFKRLKERFGTAQVFVDRGRKHIRVFSKSWPAMEDVLGM